MKLNRLLRPLLCLLLAVLLTVSASAAGRIGTDREIALTISYMDGTLPLTGARFDLYRVAEADAFGRLTPAKAFAGYSIPLDGQEGEWKELALTLKGCVLADGVDPDFTGSIDEAGSLTVGLKPGLWLAVGCRITLPDNFTYSAAPFLILLPEADAESNEWRYTASVSPKFTKAPNDPDGLGDRELTRKVLKIWDDKGAEASRPESVTVHLLRNGEIFDTQVLTAANNWRFAWDHLDPRSEWLVAEKMPENYTASVKLEGITFTVTNRYLPPKDPPKDPPKEPLPQTGQLWWPVILLPAAGLFCCAVGFSRRRVKHECDGE